MKLSEDYTPKYPKMVTFAAQLKAGQLQGFYYQDQGIVELW